MELLVGLALVGLIPAFIASNKGAHFGVWWAFGALLFIVALPMAILMKPVMVSPSGKRVTLENTSVGLVTCPSCSWKVPLGKNTCAKCGVPFNARSLPNDLTTRLFSQQTPNTVPIVVAPMDQKVKLCCEGHRVSTTARFCPECGSPTTARCPNDHLVESGAKFCAECGSPIDGKRGVPEEPPAAAGS
jgi:hypothetical protein